MLELHEVILTYLLMIPVFFAIDMLWLGVIAKDIYKKKLGHLMAAKVQWPAAIIFYLLYIFGTLFFAVLPGLEAESLLTTLTHGALFGLLAYGTYDLTNLATLKDWPKSIVSIDLTWGVALTTLVAATGYFAGLWVS